jgi:hypothetical protein
VRWVVGGREERKQIIKIYNRLGSRYFGDKLSIGKKTESLCRVSC